METRNLQGKISTACVSKGLFMYERVMLKVWAVDEILELDETCETGKEDATTSSMSTGHTQFAGTKRSRQTINVTNKPSKRSYTNVEESLTSGRQSCENVAGNEANIESILESKYALKHSINFVFIGSRTL